MTERIESLSEALFRLSERGFTNGLRAGEEGREDVSTGAVYEPELLRIDEIVRFEGATDPSEQAVLFALRSPSGAPLGTYVVVYGPGMPAEDARVVERLGTKTA